MTSIPRLIAGTAVVLCAVLTTAPVTSGIAEQLLNPSQQPTKRAASQAPTSRPPATALRTQSERRSDSEAADGADAGDRVEFGDRPPGTAADTEAPAGLLADTEAPAGLLADAGAPAGLVADTTDAAEDRVSALARDLQSGVDAGEFPQADADRVLGDISSYIRGERTWPERSVA